MKNLALIASATLLLAGAIPAQAERFCSSSRYVWMGGERVKVCCSNGLCTTRYGVYSED